MMKCILAALLAHAAAPALAQSGTGPNSYIANPDVPIADTGPRYCPELAGTAHPFRVVCPSWADRGTVAIGSPAGIRIGQGIIAENPGILVEDLEPH